ncbi:MAG: Holliday junction resolvase RuvX [Blautia sp.]|nr:Holliday junction resolvase RuvX [Blautia sp.]
MRILGLDYGARTVGVAVSDPLGLTAQPVETIWRQKENHLRQTLSRIEELAREYQAGQIVLGYPKHLNNTVGERALKSLEFKEMLERRTGLPVVMWDERLTTAAAERTLTESSIPRERQKQHMDQLAAVFILQGYMDSLQFEKGSGQAFED